jgi:tetratricopeptide (TPR) repeat protein
MNEKTNLTRCWGLTLKGRRCGRIGEWKYFCEDHNPLRIIFIISFLGFIIFQFFPAIFSYYSFFDKSQEKQINAVNGKLESLDGKLTLLSKRLLPSEDQVKSDLKENEERLGLIAVQTITNILSEYIAVQKAYKAQDYNSAITHLTKLVKDYPIASFYVALADSYSQISNFELARENFAMAVEVSKGKAEYSATVLNAYEGISHILIETGSYKEALTILERARELINHVDDDELKIAILAYTGDAYDSLSELEKAAEYYEKALNLAREVKNERMEGIVLQNMSVMESRRGNFSLAKNYVQKSLDISRRLEDRINQEINAGQLGIINKMLGEYDSAIENLNLALSLSKESGHVIGQGTWLSNLGAVYRQLKQYDKSIALLTESIEIAKKIHDRRGEIVRLGNLANVYSDLGQFNKAMSLAEESVEGSRLLADKSNEYIVLKNMGTWSAQLKQYDIAQQRFKEALAIAKDIFGDDNGQVNELKRLLVHVDQTQRRESLQQSAPFNK